MPIAFAMVESSNIEMNEMKVAWKLNAKVITDRERVIINLLRVVYGRNSVEVLSHPSPESTVSVNGNTLLIRIKSTPGFAGVKLVGNVKPDNMDNFLQSYVPSGYLLYVNVLWNTTGGLFLIPKHVQATVLHELTVENYAKVPPSGVKSSGLDISQRAMRQLLRDPNTFSLPISWGKNPSLRPIVYGGQGPGELWEAGLRLSAP